MWLARDEAPSNKRARARVFGDVRRTETQYARELRKVARHVGDIVKGFPTNEPAAIPGLIETLRKYSDLIAPWAEAAATRMLTDVARRDKNAWADMASTMSRSLKREIESAPTGRLFIQLLAEQVGLIKSLPIEAGQRVHELTIQGLMGATRASEIAKEIARSGEVTISRANLIARTEVSRTASGLVQARAQYVGSEGYVWRTSGGSSVRKDHRVLNGKFFRWSEPPVAGPNGMRYHAGAGPNCQCFPEPVLADEDYDTS